MHHLVSLCAMAPFVCMQFLHLELITPAVHEQQNHSQVLIEGLLLTFYLWWVEL